MGADTRGHTFTHGCVVLCVSGLADTLEGTECVGAVGVFVTRVVFALVDVFLTVSALETIRTFITPACLVAHSVHFTTAAVTKTILAPIAAGAGCSERRYTYLLMSTDVMHTNWQCNIFVHCLDVLFSVGFQQWFINTELPYTIFPVLFEMSSTNYYE